MPIGNHLFKVGATYEWNDLNDLPTEKAKQKLITKINVVVSPPYKIISHEAGLRPSVVDRRPEIGLILYISTFMYLKTLEQKPL
jgi:hypothetical protein